MANFGEKNGIFYVRFRFRGKEYKKSLKIRTKADADAARCLVELMIHRIFTGQVVLPSNVDAGDFIVSGGTLTEPVGPRQLPAPLPSTTELIDEFKRSQRNLIAETYFDSQALHLRHLTRYLGELADSPCDRVGFRELDGFVKARLAIRNPNTAERERITLLQFYKWAVAREYLESSPAAKLSPIKGGVDRSPFRTIAEIQRIIDRGGVGEKQTLDLWGCLYLTPEEISRLLAAVRRNAQDDFAFLLHAIPAYTGMRRGEILRLRWLDVDLDEDYITARSRKQSRTRTETARRIDLHPELKKELMAWRDQRPKGQYVISEPGTLEPVKKHCANRSFWRPMNGTEWCLDKKRQWYKIGFHTYRHSFASNLAALGADQRVIDEWMGHQTEAMRKRYRHLFPKTRRSAIESFSLAS